MSELDFQIIIKYISNLIWSDALIFLCLGAGVYFSFSTRFLQIRLIREMIRLLFSGKSSSKGVSSFQAFSIAISGRVGVGNIAGVATAIALGGPGAVFWMWAIAILGAASAYVEAVLGQIYKEVKNKQYRGGPAFYIEKGLGIKWFAVLFAVVAIVSTVFFMPVVQSNSIAESINQAFNIDRTIVGIVVCLVLGLIIFGGIKRISKVAEIVVPFMALGYILMTSVIIIYNIKEVPEIFALIFNSAFGREELFSGITGAAISMGVKRGIYSNEAGQGTAPHAAAAAEINHPAKQGLVQAFSVYVDTLFVCTATALMILFTNSYYVKDEKANQFLVEPQEVFFDAQKEVIDPGPVFTQVAVASKFPTVGAEFVAISLMFFAFTTIMAYYYIAETNLSYLASKKEKTVKLILRIVLLISVFYGAILKGSNSAWDLGDIGVGMMAWTNVIAILLLRKPALRALKDYENKRKKGLDTRFRASDIGIKNADFWDDEENINKE